MSQLAGRLVLMLGGDVIPVDIQTVAPLADALQEVSSDTDARQVVQPLTEALQNV